VSVSASVYKFKKKTKTLISSKFKTTQNSKHYSNPSMPYPPTTSKSQPQMKSSKIKAKNQNFNIMKIQNHPEFQTLLQHNPSMP